MKPNFESEQLVGQRNNHSYFSKTPTTNFNIIEVIQRDGKRSLTGRKNAVHNETPERDFYRKRRQTYYNKHFINVSIMEYITKLIGIHKSKLFLHLLVHHYSTVELI